jgi:hypothetical protein
MNIGIWKEINRKLDKKIAVLVLLFFILFSSNFSVAQTILGKSQNLSTLKVDELSDEKLLIFNKQFLESGYTKSQMEEELIKRNLPTSEIEKLQLRLKELEKSGKIKSESESKNTGKRQVERSFEKTEDETLYNNLMPKVFGSELFNNPRLSFEPNLKMATPLNYQIGPDDELLIDIYIF